MRRRHLAALPLCLLAPPGRAALPVNRVDIDGRLTTSGQPDADFLRQIGQLGVQAVISLVPVDAGDAVPEEAELVRAQGIEFLHLPIPFDRPTAADVQAVHAVLRRLEGRRVWIHCQINLRASSLVFLYRVLERHEDPVRAWIDVSRVWLPSGAWRRLIEQQLASHHIAFDLD